MGLLSRARGVAGEAVACTYLQRRGMDLVATNWTCRFGEIDLIMRDGDTLVFVEVRLRSSARYGAAADTVVGQKQRKLVRAAKLYQQQEDYWGDVRFDVVSIMRADGADPVIEHLPYAFGE